MRVVSVSLCTCDIDSLAHPQAGGGEPRGSSAHGWPAGTCSAQVNPSVRAAPASSALLGGRLCRLGGGSRLYECLPWREAPTWAGAGAGPLEGAPLRAHSSQRPHAAPGAPCGRRSWRSAYTDTSWCPSVSAGGPAGWSGRRRPCCSEGRCRASHLGEQRGHW